MVIGDIVDTENGSLMNMDELVEKLTSARVIYLGETHTSSEDHRAQLAILRKLHEKNPCIIVGMEMFPHEVQPVLDRYIRREITEEEFLREVQWEKVWGFPYQLYRGIIDFAREKRLRIIGLNAPHGVVSAIAREGLGSLSPEDRARVARDFHLDDAGNRLRIQKEYTVHGKEHIRNFESFFEAQVAWEETMAETLAEQLRVEGGKCRIVVIVGKGHISDKLGIPYLAGLRVPHESRTVASVPFDYPFSTSDPNIARYVLITDRRAPPHRLRLGVRIQATGSGKGVEVIDVYPDSAAARAGIRKGDVIIQVNEFPVQTAGELHGAVAAGGPKLNIVLERAARRISIVVSIED